MLLSCLKFRKNKESNNPRMAKINKGKLILLSRCAVCDKIEIYKKPSKQIVKYLRIKTTFK